MLSQMIELASKSHAGQKRKYTGLDYLFHLFEVTKKVSEYGFRINESSGHFAEYSDNLLTAAMGHDLIEDTSVSYEDIKSQFGEEVANVILECTNQDGQDKWEYLCSFKNKSIESCIIKIADRYCNIMDFYTFDKKYAAKYALRSVALCYYVLSKKMKKKMKSKILKDIEQIGHIISTRYDLEDFKTLDALKEAIK